MSGSQVLDHKARENHVPQFRVIILTSEEPHQAKQLLRHFGTALPDLRLSLLCEYPRLALTADGRPRRAPKLIPSPAPVRSALGGPAMQIRAASIGLLDRVLRWLHTAPKYPNPGTLTPDELRDYAESKGVRFCLTEDSRSQASSDFVRRMNPDLGVLYGARIQDMELVGIPRKGSITLDVHDHVKQQGGGDPGLSGANGRRKVRTISVHRVSAEVNSGALLGERTFPVEQYDTPESIAVKASLLGIECLADVIRSESLGCAEARPQGPSGTVREEDRHHPDVQAGGASRPNRRGFRPTYGRPLIKLLARLLFYPRAFLMNRHRAADQSFPIVILFGHVVADRPKFMGISTDQFLRQVQFLKKHYRIASLPEAIDMIRERRVPAPTVVLTFDDGYEDNHLGLRAVIDSEDIPVTLFVCTKNVEEHRPFDHDLKRGESGFFPLTWDHLKDFELQGSTIGSHTRTHFDCGSTEESVLRSEIVGAQEDLRRHLGHAVPYFSFPWGYPKNMSSAAVTIASETYPHLFAAYGGFNDVRNPGALVFKRVSWPESLLELELSLQGLLDFRKDELCGFPAIAERPAPPNERPDLGAALSVSGNRAT
jgi:hypothetical protein